MVEGNDAAEQLFQEKTVMIIKSIIKIIIIGNLCVLMALNSSSLINELK
jgi:hypothetical protein